MSQPAGNPGLRREVGPDVSYLPTRLIRATERGGTITFLSTDGGDKVEWAVLHEEAKAMAVALARRGVGPGAHVALLGPTSRPFVTAIQAVWLAGATVVLPLPMRMGSLDDFVASTRTGCWPPTRRCWSPTRCCRGSSSPSRATRRWRSFPI